MSGASLLTSLLIAWGVVTAVFLVFFVWKSLASITEEDVVILNPVEDEKAKEQQIFLKKVQRLSFLAKGFGLASLVLLLAAGGLWLYQGLQML